MAMILFSSAFAEEAIPEELVVTPAGRLTIFRYRQALIDAVMKHPQTFGVPQEFFHFVIVRAEAKQQKLGVSDEEISRRTAEFKEKPAGISAGDLRRMIRDGMLLEKVVRKRYSMPEKVRISDAIATEALEGLRKKYKPAFHGFKNVERVATVGGVNYSMDHISDFLLSQARDSILNRVFDAEVNKLLLQTEADRRQAKTANPAVLFAAELSGTALLKYYDSIKARFRVIHIAHLLCSFDKEKGWQVGQVDEATQAKTKKRADSVRESMTQENFSALAGKQSDCPSAAEAGDLGFLTQDRSLLMLPPRLWALDVIRTTTGSYSPITLTPDRAIYTTAETLKDGELSPPVKTRAGYSIVKRISSRMPADPNQLLPYLRQQRQTELTVNLLARLRKDKKVTFMWTPEQR